MAFCIYNENKQKFLLDVSLKATWAAENQMKTIIININITVYDLRQPIKFALLHCLVSTWWVNVSLSRANMELFYLAFFKTNEHLKRSNIFFFSYFMYLQQSLCSFRASIVWKWYKVFLRISMENIIIINLIRREARRAGARPSVAHIRHVAYKTVF